MTQPQSFCPYAGLQPYTEQEREYFFGREEDQETIAANLVTTPLTIVYGGSGVGKTSVLLAGVVPFVRKLPGVVIVMYREWQHDTYLVSLKKCLSHAVSKKTGHPFSAVDLPLDELLHQAAKETGCTLTVILDQFEEYFLYHSESESGNQFDSEFARTVNRSEVDAKFLLSIREDNLASLDRFQKRIPALFDNYIRIEQLSRTPARGAIEKPLEKYNSVYGTNIGIEPALVDEVLDKVSRGRVTLGEGGKGVVADSTGRNAEQERIETPYLQLVMTRLWAEEDPADSSVLRIATLHSLGGTEKIAETHLDNILDEFDTDKQDMIVRIFSYLVTPGGAKIALDLDDLARYGQASQDQIEPVLEQLSDQNHRILRLVAPPPDRPTESRYEIFHDVLAPAILRWCRKRDQEKAVQQAALEASNAAREATIRGLRMLGLVSLLVVLVGAGLLLRASIDKNRELKKTQIEKLVLEKQLVDAQNALTEHLVTISVPQILVFFFPEDVGDISFIPLRTDPNLDLTVAGGFAKRGRECARLSAKNLDKAMLVQADDVSSCPADIEPETQAKDDLNTALELVENSEQRNFDQFWSEQLRLRSTARFVPEAILAFEQAREYARDENTYGESVAAAQKAFELQPTLLPTEPEPGISAAYGARAEIALVEGKFDTSREYLKRAIELDAVSRVAIATSWRKLGARFVQECEIDLTLDAFLQANELGLNLDSQTEIRGALLQRNSELGGRNQSSVPEAAEALALGRVCAVKGYSAAALDAFQRAVALDPGLDLIPEAEVALQRGLEAARQGRFEDAAEDLDTARENDPSVQLEDPKISRAFESEAYTALSKGNEYSRVLNYLSHAALYVDSRDEIAMNCVNVGRQYVELGQSDAALSAFQLAVELNPELQLVPEDEAMRIGTELQ